ncbi:phosphoribosylglycinamide formyltransferase [Hydrogenovibrio sp. 3SP14C1]|uniref:phosphoribosylglycinamide formyltransferase n=1 Tax=Hydrogenovibrio sp. 3SP14C1 TaxID=3038774 RepID=UPI002417748B|nr:phosphoribosylglycinamide formyltransferase [Hydrogenovibrio sp. 3SP14C1]MDG4812509.1 phosphoribosylglycinamide formyltransferase [Hydrogenovibrio sp. 3SP14C1]
MRIAVLISGKGSNLQALIDQADQAHYEIGLVLSNRPHAEGLKKAEQAGIPTAILDHSQFESREAFDTAMIQIIDNYKIEVVILAGFMRILTPIFTDHFLGRMLNIHPSLLPKYPGLNTHQRALDADDKEHGLSIHFVTSELDGGPVILQAKVPITNEDTAETLQKKIQLQEHIAYPLVTNWLASGDLIFKNNQVWYKNAPLTTPIQLTEL